MVKISHGKYNIMLYLMCIPGGAAHSRLLCATFASHTGAVGGPLGVVRFPPTISRVFFYRI